MNQTRASQSATSTLSPKIRRSPYFAAAERAGARSYSVYNHMYMPAGYGLEKEVEYEALTTAAVLWDVGAERQVSVSGQDARAFVSYLTTRNLDRFEEGQCLYALCCDEAGIIICDPVLLHVAADTIWLSHGDVDLLLWAKAIALHTAYDVRVDEPDVGPLQLQGPNSRQILSTVAGAAIDDLAYFSCLRAEISGAEVVISRTGWSGELGYEIYPLGSERADEIWDSILAAGEPWGLRVTGPSRERGLEAGFTDINYWENSDSRFRVNALEFGRARVVDLDKPDFVGRAALVQIKEAGGPRRTLVGLLGSTEELPRMHEPWEITSPGGGSVGATSYATWSRALGRNIAIGVVAIEQARPGTELVLQHPDRSEPVVVSELPFVDPERSRRRA